MALNISTPITLDTGITVETSFARVAVTDSVDGTQLQSSANVYKSEEDYEAGKFRLDFTVAVNTPYDRAADGTDILDLAHDAIIAYLAGEGITATKVL